MFARQMGQPRARLYTSSAQDEQKRRCPHGTRAMLLSRAATKQTSQSSLPSPSVGLLSAAAVASDTAALSASASSFSESVFSYLQTVGVCTHAVAYSSQELHPHVRVAVEPANIIPMRTAIKCADFDSCIVHKVGALLGTSNTKTAVQSLYFCFVVRSCLMTVIQL